MSQSKKSKGQKRLPGMKPGMKFAQRLNATLDDHDRAADSCGKIMEQDMMLIALKRMGILGETRLLELHETLKQVRKEHYDRCIDDAKDDKKIWYTKECVDRDLRVVLGKYFVDWDERYELDFKSMGIRAVELWEAKHNE